MVLKIFIVGWGILFVAIILNFFAVRFGIWTWYQFIEEIVKSGLIKSFSNSSLLSKLFLFIIYPLLLGLTAFFILQRLK